MNLTKQYSTCIIFFRKECLKDSSYSQFFVYNGYQFSMSIQVATLGYRAPEHLLGSTYSSPVDVWAVGCVFAEMVTQKPLFNGFCDDDVLISIFRYYVA